MVVVSDLAAAQRIYAAGTFEGTLVTRQGEVLGADGRLTGGSGEDAGAHMLEIKREIRELGPLVVRLEQEMTACQARVSELRAAIASRQAELDAARSEGHDAELSIVRAEKDLKRAEEELARARDRVDQLAFETDDMSSSLAEQGSEESEAREEIARAKAVREQAQQDFLGFEQASRERRSAVEAQNAIVTEIRVRAAEARQRVQSDRIALERVERGLAELSTRLVRVERELVDNVEKQGQHGGAASCCDRETLGDTVGEAKSRRGRADARRAPSTTPRSSTCCGHESALKALRSRIDAASSSENAADHQGARADHVARRGSWSRSRSATALDVRNNLTDYHARELPDAQAVERVQELERLLERMGPINLTAIEEYEEQSKRFEYLSAQKKDLETRSPSWSRPSSR